MSGPTTAPRLDAIGPYRVEERLGGGGMGEVFKAYDARLDRWVAIKRLLPDRRETARSRERFRREARAAARLNHPAIVHVYDIFQDGDHDCIVLELVEGQSLASVLRQGPLEPLAACRLAYVIAEGLGEAHSKGILHRDLKAENVVVTPSGRAKILDFGLAKPLERVGDESSLTGEGHLVGTIKALAPEQARGEAVDHRADLFALGVLLYEALTGRSPFAARSAVASLTQLMNSQPKPVRELVEGVPEDLSRLVDALLAKAPAERPGSADEVALELRRIASRLAGAAAPDTEGGATATVKVIARWPRRAAAAGLGALVVAAGLALPRFLEPPRRELAARDLVVVADFVNATGDPTMGAPLHTAFRVGLEQSPLVRLLSDAERREVLRRMEREPSAGVDRGLGIEICRREGGRVVVVGEVVAAGSDFALSAEVVEPLKGRTVFTETVRVGEPARLLEGVERLTRRLRARLGTSLAAPAELGAPLERVTTRDLAALELYTLAVGKSREGDDDAARPLLLEAVARDPTFAMAHAQLANLERRTAGDPVAAERHLDFALRNGERLTEVERLYVRGWAATWRGPLGEVLEAWSLLTSLHPEERRGHHNLALARWLYQNRFEDARAGFDTAADSAGNLRVVSLGRRGYCEIALGRSADAIATFEALASASRDSFQLGRLDALLAADSLSEATAELERWTAHPSTAVRHEAELRRAWLALDRGRFAEAARTAALLSRLATGATALDARLARIAALAELDDRPTLLALAREAAEGPLRRLGADPGRALDSPIGVVVLIARAAVRAGDLAFGRQVLAAVEPGAERSGYPIWEAYERVLAAELAAAEGRLGEARALLAASLERLDTTAAHAGMARVLAAQGDLRGALAESEWLLAHRGRAFGEGWELTRETAFDLVDWSLALARRGRLAEALGDRETAARSYLELVERWPEPNEHPERRAAAARLAGPLAGVAGRGVSN